MPFDIYFDIKTIEIYLARRITDYDMNVLDGDFASKNVRTAQSSPMWYACSHPGGSALTGWYVLTMETCPDTRNE